ncbi:MAG: hypothetical protein GX569_00960, partial [Candidatus Riflebacteria bacterium]|nr:hypothetical protein [Candidatus Riflebacteria bacterium]
MGRYQLSVNSGLMSFCRKSLLLCLVLFSCVSVMGEEQAAPGIKEQFEQKISELVGVPVSAKDYQLSYTTVTLSGIRIGDAARPELPSAQIKELSATCDFMSLLGGNLVMKEVNVKSLKASLTLDAKGKPVLGSISRPASGSLEMAIEDLPFDKLSGSKLELR